MSALQTFPWSRVGLRARRPDPRALRSGYTYYAHDTQEGFILGIVNNVRQWFSFGGAGQLPKYWVNVSGQQPTTLYTSIQTAVDAAVSDGHNSTNPAAIFVLPGTYTENITVPVGIFIIGMAEWSTRSFVTVRIDGSVTLTSATTGAHVLMGLNITGLISVTGASTIGARFDRVTSVRTTGIGCQWNNSNSSSALELNECRFLTLDPDANVAAFSASSVGLTASETKFEHTSSSRAFDVQGGAHRLRDCEFTGRVIVGTGTKEFIDPIFTASGQQAMAAGAGAMVVVDGGLIDCDQDQWISGSGTLTYRGRPAFRGPSGKDPNIANNVEMVIIQLTREGVFAGAGPHSFPTDRNLMLIDTLGAGSTAVFPAINTVEDGRVLIIKSLGIAGDITVNPQPGNTIEGAASNTMLAGASGKQARWFRADNATSDWQVLASHP